MVDNYNPKDDIKIWVSEDATNSEKYNAKKRILNVLRKGIWSDNREIIDEMAKTPGTSSLAFFILGDKEIDIETKVECLEELAETHGKYLYLAAYLMKFTGDKRIDILNVERVGIAAFNIFKREHRYNGTVEKNLFDQMISEWYVHRRISESYINMLSNLLSLHSEVQNSDNPKQALNDLWQQCYEKYNVPEKLKNRIGTVLKRRPMVIR